MNKIHYHENVGMALQTLMAHKFRSFLTVLGIIIGVVTVIVIASILTGLRQNVITFVEEFGTDNSLPSTSTPVLASAGGHERNGCGNRSRSRTPEPFANARRCAM